MKRNYLKRIISVSLAAVMTLNLAACGCGSKKKESVADEEVSHDATAYVFKENAVSLGEGVDTANIVSLGTFGDKVYAVGNSISEEEKNVTTLFTFDKDGSNLKPVDLALDDNYSITNTAVATDGSIYAIETKYGGMDAGFGDINIQDIMGGGDGSMEIIGGSDSDEGIVVDDIDQYSAEDEVEAADSSEDEGTDSEAAASESSEGVKEENTADSTKEDASTPEELNSSMENAASEETSTLEQGDGEIVDSSIVAAEDEYYLVKRDANGTEAWRQKLESKTDSYFYVTSLVLADDNTILVSDTLGIHKYSTENGSKTSDFNLDEYIDSEYGVSIQIFKTGDGNLVGMISGGNQAFYRLDTNAGTITPVEAVDNPFYDYVFYSGAGSHDLFAVGSEGVYTYNLGDQNVSMILNFVDSDINTYGLSQMVAISDTEIVALIPSDENGFTLSSLTKVDPKAVSDRQQITLGCNYIDFDVRSQIIKFNKTNDKYRIVINDYSKYDSDSEYTGGANRLNTDIVSGNAPDIIVLDSDMPVDSYISKGLFEDMTEYFTNDEELSKNKYMDHVMDTFKTDGKMYKVIPSFYVETVAAYKKDAGDDYTWTIDELEKIVKDRNIKYKNIFGALARDEVFDMALTLTGSQYIDWSTLTCSYNSDAFIHLLEFINEFPEELEEDDYYNDSSAFWRQGISVADRLYLYSLSDYNYEAKGTFGDEITTAGFPSDNGSGSAIFPNLQLTMNASSKVKDGCWEFMRYFLTNDYQKTIEGAFPVSMTKMDELIANAKKKPSYLDEEGKEVEYDDTYYIGETEVIINPMTDEEVNKVIDFINSIDQVGNGNEEVANIIYEEAAAYFSGQKTAAEVADIIQSRVQIYVNEIS
ncbi:ABC transporter substrate-binding protein [Butyrivibrio sp. AE3004]|uniref:ABC transporter substrate-binding protein n=1 Tax=Butyrivibrio sp. AE3004 TaxID=1506994 RepID=UPI000493F78B|nr:extracellular solute-binding protein [Butyrivibrio sp. AE3004]